jgi:PadR family transcriptional regulator, regulatory protein PadR
VLYPLLARLTAAGWLIDECEKIDPSKAGRPKRRLYRLTGEAHLKARAALSAFARSG